MSFIDQTARNWAQTGLDLSIVLSAGAGTGKTSVLALRLVNLLETGIEPSKVAVISATQAAAGTLHQRVQRIFDARLRSAGNENSPRQMRLQGILQRLHLLEVTTLHEFCRHILICEGFESSWAPDTRTQAEGLYAETVRTAFHQWRGAFDRRHHDVAARVRHLVSDRALYEAALLLLRHRDLEPAVGRAVLDATGARMELMALFGALESAIALCRKPKRCKLLANNSELFTFLKDLVDVDSDLEAVALALDGPIEGSLNGGRTADWPDGNPDVLRDVVADYRAWRARWRRARVAVWHRVVIRDMYDRLLPMVDRRKREAAQADHDDPLFRVQELLTQDGQARARLHQRWEAIFMDEVEDADPIQLQIACLLTRSAELEGPWNAVPPMQGRLFAAGDSKQSTNASQRVDPKGWNDLQDLITKDGELLWLSLNFRAVPGLVAWVNHVYRGTASYTEQIPNRKAAKLDPVVVLAADPLDETDAVVRHLRDLKDAASDIDDPLSQESRPMLWSDVLILCPTWRDAERVLGKCLRANLPAVVTGGGGFLARDEVQLSLMALKAIAEPADAEAVVAVLRGLFGLSLEELARHVAQKGHWRYTDQHQPPGRATEALEVLRGLHLDRGQHSLLTSLDRLFEQTQSPAVWALTPRGPAILDNLDRLKALIRHFESAGMRSRDVVSKLQYWAIRNSDLLRFAESDADQVRISTYAHAKGIESPVVALVGARSSDGPLMYAVDREQGLIAIRAGSLFPPSWDQWVHRGQLTRVEELRHWIHIAVTRARDQVVFAVTPDSDLLRHDLSRGWPAALQDVQHDTEVEIAPGATVKVRQSAELTPVDATDETFRGIDKTLDTLLAKPERTTGTLSAVGSRRTLDSRGQRLLAARSTSLASCARWDSVASVDAQLRLPLAGDYTGAYGPTSGRNLVRLVADVMKGLDLSKPVNVLSKTLETETQRAARRANVRHELVPTAVDAVTNILASPIFERAEKAPYHWCQLDFTLPPEANPSGSASDDVEAPLIIGRIDLCFPVDEAETNWVAVDWTRHLHTDEPRDYADALGRFAQQALGSVSSCENVEVYLIDLQLYLESATPIERALERVRPELSAILDSLLDASTPAPEVGLSVYDDEQAVATLELAWSGSQFGLGLDLDEDQERALSKLGWDVLVVSTVESNWTSQVLEGLMVCLGLTQVDETADPEPRILLRR